MEGNILIDHAHPFDSMVGKSHGSSCKRARNISLAAATTAPLFFKILRELSRQHFKLFQQEGAWIAESLSRFVPLSQDVRRGHTKPSLSTAAAVFYAPPYEFVYLGSAAKEEAAPKNKSAENEDPRNRPQDPIPDTDRSDHSTEGTAFRRGNLEATLAGGVVLVPFLPHRLS